jgi:hypothetical protein
MEIVWSGAFCARVLPNEEPASGASVIATNTIGKELSILP